MGFFSDMDESDFAEQPKEQKPIVIDPKAADACDDIDETDVTQEVMVSRVDLGEDMDDTSDLVSNQPDYIEDPEEYDDDFGEPLVQEPASVSKSKTVKPEPAPPAAKNNKKAVDVTNTVIAKGTTITGGIHSEDDILIEGTVEGSVEAKSVLIQNGGQVREGIIAKENLEIHGNIDGDISGKDIRLYQSKVHGNLTSEGSVYVDKTSVLNSDIQAESIEIYGRVKGEISVNGKATIHRGSVVKGSVRCKDILLETGAKFQGAVEQISEEDIDDSLFE